MFDLKSLRGKTFYFPSVLKEIKQEPKLFKKLEALSERFDYTLDQALYHLVFPKTSSKCKNPDCVNQTRYIRNSGRWGYLDYCSKQCVGKTKAVVEKRKQTCLVVYGGLSPMNCAEVRKRAKATCVEKYGGNSSMSCDRVRAKMEDTLEKTYGVRNAGKSKLIRRKAESTMRSRYGVDHALQVPKFKRRFENTMTSRYGVKNATQNAELLESAQRHRTHHLRLKGRTFRYQGYEHHALKVLVNQLKVPVNLLQTDPSKQREIIWTGRDGKQHRYYPDIRIVTNSKDVSIEVKSLYTAGVYDENTFSKVKSKAQGAFECGVDLRLWIVDPKSKSIVRIKDVHTLDHKTLISLVQ